MATTFPARQLHNNRGLRAAAALLLCVALTSALLFSRLVSYAAMDTRQYIPLTESNGITTVFATQQDTGLSWKSGGFAPNRPLLLAAGPFLTADWFRVTDENTVWNGNTNVEIFRVSYENGQQQITVKSGRGDKVIAPGTENSYTFALENTAQNSVAYDLTMEAYLSDNICSLPVEVTVKKDIDNVYLLGSASEWRDVQELNQVQDSGTLKKGYVMPYTLSWQWPFEGDDDYDTYLGNLAGEEDLTLTIVIKTAASYVPPSTDDDGIPKTGDTSHIGMWFAVMLGSAAGLMFLLLLMRRKGEEDEKA